MLEFIQNFYYGNLDPEARSVKADEAMAEELQILADTEEYLTDKLTGEEKSRFLDLVNAWSVVNGESCLDSFIVGFRMGAAAKVSGISLTSWQVIKSPIERPARYTRLGSTLYISRTYSSNILKANT